MEESYLQKFKLETPEGIVAYYDYGNPNNPALICLHGLAGNGFYSFNELAPHLNEQFRLIVLDCPGHGETSAFQNEDDYLFSNLAAWLHQTIQKIVKGPFYILGHSWGADAALHFARFFPEKVLGLILLDGGFTFPQNQPEMTFEYAYAGWNEYMKKSVFKNEQAIYNEYRTYTSNWDDKKELHAASLFKKRADEYFELTASTFTVLAIIKAFFKEPFADAYPFINAPTLLIHAAAPVSLNAARTRGIRQLQENIKDVSVVVIEDSSHMIQWDNPKETAASILKWLSLV